MSFKQQTTDDFSGAEILTAPIDHCDDHPHMTLELKNEGVTGRLYTKGRGIVPVFPVAKYCQGKLGGACLRCQRQMSDTLH